SPRTVRESIAAGEMPAHAVLDGLVDATIASMRRNASTHRMVLAHLFSLVPKMGLAEDDVSDEAIDRLATAAAETSTIIEVSERWRCPGHRVVRAALRHHVQVVASTDSHRSADIGQYEWVAS